MGARTIYERAVAMGAVIGNHESDLHLRDTPEVVAMLERHNSTSGHRWLYERTRSAGGQPFIEVPFAYDPWWAASARDSPKLLPKQLALSVDTTACAALLAEMLRAILDRQDVEDGSDGPRPDAVMSLGMIHDRRGTAWTDRAESVLKRLGVKF